MISERLRDNYMPMRGGFGAWHIDPLSLEAAEVIDALVAVVEAFSARVPKVARNQPPDTLVARAGIELELFLAADAALAMARRK